MSDFQAENIDIESEKAIIGTLLSENGYEVWNDISDIIGPNTFVADVHQVVYKCVNAIFKNHSDVKKINYPLLLNTSKTLNFGNFLENKDEKKYLTQVSKISVDKSNARIISAKLRKLEVVRVIRNELSNADKKYQKITGEEKLTDLINIIEQPIADLSQSLHGAESKVTESLFEDIEEWVEDRIANPKPFVGIPTGYPSLDRAIGGGMRLGTVGAIASRFGQGKALRHGSKVYCPNGYKKIEEIMINDEILTPNGKAIVTHVHPQGLVDIYRVYFKTGSYVDTCGEHLWKIKYFRDFKHKKHDRLYTTKEMYQSETKLKYKNCKSCKYYVELTNPCQYNEQKVPLDPYLLGLLLGDGGIKIGINITTADKEIVDYFYNWLDSEKDSSYIIRVARKLNNKAATYHLSQTNIGGNGGTFNKYVNILKSLNLYGLSSHFKFIPDIYKYNSEEVRWSVLQGLLDTDGSISKTGDIEYTTTSESLAEDFQELVTSLGGICTKTARYTSYSGKTGKQFLSFRLRPIFPNNSKCFRLPRKLTRVKPRNMRGLKNIICKIEKITQDYATCITINTKEGLFLTNNHIVTHNSLMGENIGYYVAAELGYPVLMLDSEMSKDERKPRDLALVSGVPITEIEQSLFINNSEKVRKVREAAKILKKLHDNNLYDYRNISGLEFDEIVAIMKNWVMTKVGLDAHGAAKPCLIVFDYLKVQSSEGITKNIAEYIYLGLMLTAFVNFCQKYKVAGLTFAQVNREGLKSEESDVIASSDRINWFLSWNAFMKPQSEEEISAQREMGITDPYDRKLIILKARHGSGLDMGNFINLRFRRHIAKFECGPTNFDLEREVNVVGQEAIVVDTTTEF